ncbi:MAG TPA: NADH-quinone oxidoreductase subunit C [Candidatus Eisenbacteria bacterium]|nr:NADH-quinone oxidoreductase subunit C [Candidatus Eisenbacteria bacterium]
MGLTPEDLLARVSVLLPHATALPLADTRGQAVVMVAVDRAEASLRALRDEPALRFDFLADLSAVDYLGRTPRFEVVYQLASHPHHHRLRVKVAVDGPEPVVPTASGLWKSALWAEREAFDMFGIRFDGHPDLRRILMYPEFEGHPLRKDYPLNQRWPLVPERDPITEPWFPRTEGR